MKNGNQISLHINGIVEDTSTLDSYSVSGDASLQLGAWNGNPGTAGPGDAFLNGDLDEVLLFNAPLNSRGINAFYQLGVCKDS